MDLEEITLQAIELVRETGAFLREETHKFTEDDIEEKGIHNLVTYVDKEAERRLVSGLSNLVTDTGFIVEENQSLKPAEVMNWIIDPLDGTTNYIHRIPVFSISVALQKDDEYILGIVYEPGRDECFYTWEGAPAYLNGNPVSVSDTAVLDDSLLATGFPYHDYSRMKPYLALFDDLMRNSRGIRRLGSAAVDLAYVACGRFDVFYEYGLNLWDIAAGVLLVRNAGGKVTDFINGKGFAEEKNIVASNGKIHREFLDKVAHHFQGDS